MKRLLLSMMFIISLFGSAVYAQRQSHEQLFAELTAKAREYEKIHVGRHSRHDCAKIVKEIEMLDFELQKASALELLSKIDTLTYTGSDYRRVGATFEASGFDDAALFCYARGAVLGDVYCCNSLFVYLLTSTQSVIDTLSAIDTKNGFLHPPFMHNLALALLKSGYPELEETGRMMGELFFTDFDDPDYEKPLYNISEFLDYDDSPDVEKNCKWKKLSWKDIDGIGQIGATLRRLLSGGV